MSLIILSSIMGSESLCEKSITLEDARESCHAERPNDAVYHSTITEISDENLEKFITTIQRHELLDRKRAAEKSSQERFCLSDLQRKMLGEIIAFAQSLQIERPHFDVVFMAIKNALR